MNQNQLIKSLKRAGDAYANTANYAKILEHTPCVKISLNEITNSNRILEEWNKVMDSSVSLPWGSILFDVRDFPMPNYLTGATEPQNMGIHMQAIVVEMNKAQIPLLLLQDWRAADKVVIGKTYLMYGDQAGMHTMCSVDSLATGCKCYKQNVFSNPEYALEVHSHTPCFSGDVGLSLPDCSQRSPSCASTVVQRKEVTDIAKLIMVFANLPSNCLVRVSDTSRSKLTLSNVYYLFVDENQLNKLRAGDDTAELSGNLFTDGSNLMMELKKPVFAPKIEPFHIGNKKYEVVIDKVRKGSSDSTTGNEQSGSPMGADLSEDTQTNPMP